MTTISDRQSTPLITGPSGRAIAQPMEDSLISAFQDHLTFERNASAVYFAMAIWFSERELRGFSKFFSDESSSEQQHAAKFADYLIARGQTVELQEIPAPNQQWKSVEEIINYAFKMEAENTTSVQQLYSSAERSSDVRTTVFLDPIVDNQLTSENEFAYLLGRVKFAENNSSALLIIDGELYEGKNSPAKLS